MSKPVGPYTPVVRAGDWLVVSGQIGVSEGALVPGGFDAEIGQALFNLGSVLIAEGATLYDVVKTTVFLRDIADYPAMNAAYTQVFGGHRPARSAVAVAALPMGASVEIEAWAYLPQP